MTVAVADSDQVLELRGVMTALNVLRVLSPDLEAIARSLDTRIREAPDLFNGAPVVLDVSALAGDLEAGTRPLQGLRLGHLTDLLKTRGLVPVAVSGLPAGRQHEAKAAGLGLLDAIGSKQRVARRAPEAKPAPEPEPAPEAEEVLAAPPQADPGGGTLTLAQPLRSGQIVYADGRDAIALAAINAGAELIADGNIHIYSSLRGRAMAGARGNVDARIFCQKFEADLVSIAGVYLSADEIPKQHRGKAVQISLLHGELAFSELISR
ncbi:MAG TPA: septum site-determining protein MinC [Polyangiales bacterium]|nr:septum site-determining protein MinC [Polyangiales bacterium]